MFDMVVNLYNEHIFDNTENMVEADISIVRVRSILSDKTLEFIKNNFSEFWTSEAKTSIYKNPADCYIAVCDNKIVGFSCFNTSANGFFGPAGVKSEFRGKGIGKALLNQSLLAMRNQGYAYAIIGGVGSAAEFYEKTVKAQKILESENHNIYQKLGFKL